MENKNQIQSTDQKEDNVEPKDLKDKEEGLKETIERHLSGKIIHFENLPAKITDLFTNYFTLDFSINFLQCIKYYDTIYRIRLFSENQEFIIRIDLDRDYIGCVMNQRKSYPGETWIRGNDYPDGKLSAQGHEIMFNILNRIYKNTFCPISENIKP